MVTPDVTEREETMRTRLEELRVERGMSEPELARRARVSINTVRTLAGKLPEHPVETMRLDTLRRIARALGVAPADVLPDLAGRRRAS